MKLVVKIGVKGLGEIPSFKNTKMITRGKLITDPKKQKRMERITRAIEYQLRCALLIDETGTVMECIPPSKIVSSLPLDDSLAWIGSHSVNWRRVKKGDEGFELCITSGLK